VLWRWVYVKKNRCVHFITRSFRRRFLFEFGPVKHIHQKVVISNSKYKRIPRTESPTYREKTRPKTAAFLRWTPSLWGQLHGMRGPNCKKLKILGRSRLLGDWACSLVDHCPLRWSTLLGMIMMGRAKDWECTVGLLE